MGGTTKYAKDTKMGTQIIFKEESYKIVGACFEVYKDKRNGFLEAVYQECLSMEFTEQGIPFVEKTRIRLDYKGRELRQTYEPDFLCFEKILFSLFSSRCVRINAKCNVLTAELRKNEISATYSILNI